MLKGFYVHVVSVFNPVSCSCGYVCSFVVFSVDQSLSLFAPCINIPCVSLVLCKLLNVEVCCFSWWLCSSVNKIKNINKSK